MRNLYADLLIVFGGVAATVWGFTEGDVYMAIGLAGFITLNLRWIAWVCED